MRAIESFAEEHVRALQRLYRNEWWTKTRRLADVRTMLRNTDLAIGLVDERTNDLAAFARVLTDGVFKALVFDVIVDPSYRGRGLGKEIMRRLFEHPRLGSVRHFELYCLPELEPFYEELGFSADVDGVRLMRRRQDS